MATSQMSEVIQHLRRAVLLRDGAGLTDEQLLEDYISRRDEAALAALVRRHGPMVWGVCRRVLRNYHDAEDAFQATFLVLVRKVASIGSRHLLANWLYGVAHQTALNARATAARRGARERQVREMPESELIQQDRWHDLQPLVDQELSCLHDKYRIPIVLCDLEGKTRKEAAQQLGCPEGTVAGRLARARGMLAKRLARHGVVLSGGGVVALLSQNVASAGVPTSVVSATIKAATVFAAGQAAATGVISVKVAALTEGVLRTMLLNKLRSVLVALVLVVTVLAGGGGILPLTRAGEQGNELTIPLKTDGDKKLADEDFNKTILAMEARYWEAATKRDAEAMSEFYADDYICFSERGRSDKAANVAADKHFRSANPKFRNVEIVRLNKDAAIITYRFDVDALTHDGTVAIRVRDSRVSRGWARRDGRWVMVFTQITQMPSVDRGVRH
jgi:RNA polymerase sigma factor (sigma-70 family)